MTLSGVTTDSRTVTSGDLFVALKGERFDGHEFVAAARTKGCVAAMVRLDSGLRTQGLAPAGFPLLEVEDTRQALGKLAAYWRSRFNMPLIAITGSNGKTTVKEMLALILQEAVARGSARSSPLDPQARVLATKGNLNNDIGVPLTLLGLRPSHRYAVVEMGTNHPGEIAYLTRLALPEVALVNNAAAAHLEGLGSVEAVARAKGEIFAGLKEGGIAVINADDEFAALWRGLAAKHRVVDFGLERRAGLTAQYRLDKYESEVTLHTPQGDVALSLRVPGVHNVRNALAAAAAAVALNVEPQAIGAGLSRFDGIKGRLQRKPGGQGATLIDDTYNANPDSVRAALAVLGAATGKKILVLGDMGELGPGAAELHAAIGAEARRSGIDILLTLGELSAAAAKQYGEGARHFDSIEDLLAEISKLLAPGVTLLVKGSRFMQMERVVKELEVKDED